MADQQTGIRNTAVGSLAGTGITTGERNTFVGYGTGSTLATVNGSTAIGDSAYADRDAQVALGSDTVDTLRMFDAIAMRGYSALRNYYIGNAGNGTATGGTNIGVGHGAMSLMTDGHDNVAVGDQTMPAAGGGSVAVGSSAMYSSSTCWDCTAMGYEALGAAVSGVGTTAIGRRASGKETVARNTTSVGDSALWLNQSFHNTAMGYRAAEYFTTGEENVFLGTTCAVNRQTGNQNVIVGPLANSFPAIVPDPVTGVGAVTCGDRNSALGYCSIPVFTGNDTAAVGWKAFSLLSSGDKNTGIGVDVGSTITTGTLNTFAGYNAGKNGSQLATATNSTAIGANAFTTASNQVVIGDANITETILRGAVKASLSLGVLSSGSGAFYLTLVNSENLTANRNLTITLNDAARTWNMGGNFTIGGNFTTAGAASLPAIAQGDLWYGFATGVITALAKDANATRYLSNTGTTNNPAWAQIDLADGVTGDLPFANLTQGAALSVLGVTGNSIADVASITAGADFNIMRRSGTAIAFGAIDLSQAGAVGSSILPVANGGTGVTAFPAFSVHRNGADQTAAATATFTKLQFTTEEFDTNSNFDNATNYRFTPTVAGKYIINASVTILSLASGSRMAVSIYKNGAVFKNSGPGNTGAAGVIQAVVSAVVDFNGSTDYVEFFVFHSNGSNRDIYGGTEGTYATGIRIA